MAVRTPRPVISVISATSQRIHDTTLRLKGPHGILGRSIVVHADEDDLGEWEVVILSASAPRGTRAERILCGVIGYKIMNCMHISATVSFLSTHPTTLSYRTHRSYENASTLSVDRDGMCHPSHYEKRECSGVRNGGAPCATCRS